MAHEHDTPRDLPQPPSVPAIERDDRPTGRFRAVVPDVYAPWLIAAVLFHALVVATAAAVIAGALHGR